MLGPTLQMTLKMTVHYCRDNSEKILKKRQIGDEEWTSVHRENHGRPFVRDSFSNCLLLENQHVRSIKSVGM